MAQQRTRKDLIGRYVFDAFSRKRRRALDIQVGFRARSRLIIGRTKAGVPDVGEPQGCDFGSVIIGRCCRASSQARSNLITMLLEASA